MVRVRRKSVTPLGASDEWADVGNIGLVLWSSSGIDHSDTIYANGRHQILVVLQIDLLDGQGKPLSDEASPSAAEVRRAVKILNYENEETFGTGESYGWLVSDTRNIFLSPLNVADARVPVVDAGPDRVEASRAYLYYYITATRANTAVSIGVSVELKDAYGVVRKKIKSTKNGTFHSRVDLTGIAEFVFQKDDFQWFGQQKFHGGDETDEYKLGALEDGNQWREFSYNVIIGASDSNKYFSYIYRCTVGDDGYFKGDYAFASISSGFYAYKSYIWPNNIYDSKNVLSFDGTPAASGAENTYTMQTNRSPQRSTTVRNSAGKIFISLICSFGYEFSDSYVKNPISLRVYDQYGNYGIVCVDPNLLPARYISDGMDKIEFFSNSTFFNSSSHTYDKYYYMQPLVPAEYVNICTMKAMGNGIVYVYPVEGEATPPLNDYSYKVVGAPSGNDEFRFYISPREYPDRTITPGLTQYFQADPMADGLKYAASPCWRRNTVLITDKAQENYLAYGEFIGLNQVKQTMLGMYVADALNPANPSPNMSFYAEWAFVAPQDDASSADMA